MATINEIKSEFRHHEWANQIQECQSSGQKVKEWCSSVGISPSTYYSRLRIVREEMLARQPELHKIVPVSVSSELTVNSPNLSGAVSSSKESEAVGRIMIRKSGIEIELPCNADEHIIAAMLRGLKEC
ncbi:MAG: IS66 family insertion sequence element accessory protein TnpA [Oscillospiraceae bacterium]